MKERPILFSAPMVRAILAGQKTQTRRVVKSEHVNDASIWRLDTERGLWESGIASGAPGSYGHGEYVRCPYGSPSDRLWLKECHALLAIEGEPDLCCVYRATCSDDAFDYVHRDGAIQRLTVKRWRPSIHMPRWASRITLEVIGIRVERLHDITEDDAKAEGVERYDDDGVIYYGPLNRGHASAKVAFERLWHDINGAGSWNANPWVWVVEFKHLPNPDEVK